MRVCPDTTSSVDGEGGAEDAEAFLIGDAGDAAPAHGTAFPVMPAAASSPDLKPSWKLFYYGVRARVNDTSMEIDKAFRARGYLW